MCKIERLTDCRSNHLRLFNYCIRCTAKAHTEAERHDLDRYHLRSHIVFVWVYTRNMNSEIPISSAPEPSQFETIKQKKEDALARAETSKQSRDLFYVAQAAFNWEVANNGLNGYIKELAADNAAEAKRLAAMSDEELWESLSDAVRNNDFFHYFSTQRDLVVADIRKTVQKALEASAVSDSK